MAVVINEMEVSPQAAPPAAGGGQQGQGASASSPEKIREVATALHKEAERERRLWAH